jgi:hypothetical protein
MTRDDLKLLKWGLFGALLVAGVWLFVSAIHNTIVTIAAMVVWFVALWFFFRAADRQKSKSQ